MELAVVKQSVLLTDGCHFYRPHARFIIIVVAIVFIIIIIIIIISKLFPPVEEITVDHHCGFRSNR